ncbi:MAG: OmpH family outer membrane protein [Salinivirgaceae bacterium]|jgi:outer membrane protein|nr:OmpH family outer membrane protein [Salinivirgaceae bacterium]
MKNISIVLNVVLFIGLGLLYILHFNSGSNNAKSSAAANDSSVNSSELKIAYVNIDSILLNYTFAKELNDVLTQKQTNMKANLEKDAKEFEKEAQIFQDKVQRGIFLTQQRAEEAQQQLMMRQQEIQKLEYDYTNQLGLEQQKMNAQLFDSISNYIKVYNTPEVFQVILGHSLTSNILYGSEQLDITKVILSGLNTRYTKEE